MNYRKLGSTDISNSEIGLGAQHLDEQSASTIRATVHHAIDQGINYIDLLTANRMFFCIKMAKKKWVD